MASSGSGTEGRVGIIPTMGGTKEELTADFANYFCSYAELHHQHQMLTDRTRMRAYYGALVGNAEQLRDKVVLDVGTGTGILSIWAAKAGARKVYAVEYTDMSKHAQELVKANGLEGTVEVIQSSVEELELPEKVDVIVSEWMGYFLLRESMLDSVLVARDKWLKEGGLLMPSHATIYLAPILNEEDRIERHDEYANAMREWYDFQHDMQAEYGVTVQALNGDYEKEQHHYYIMSAHWTELAAEHVIAEPVALKRLDLHTCTLQDVKGVDPTAFSFSDFDIYAGAAADEDAAGAGAGPTRVSGFAGWFTADFKGRDGASSIIPALSNEVTLDTSPANGYTHWGQSCMYLPHPVDVPKGKSLAGLIRLVRQGENKRLYNIGIRSQIVSSREEEVTAEELVWELP